MTETGQDFWTKQIKLEEISQYAFNSIRTKWGNHKPNHFYDTFASIHDPIVAGNYQELVDRFLTHPQARVIHVNSPIRGWKEFEVGEIDDRAAEEIVEIALSNSLTYNKFEMRFVPLSAEGVRERAKLKFREHNGLVVGHEISVHRDNLNLFDSRNLNPSEIIVSAICHPEDVKY